MVAEKLSVYARRGEKVVTIEDPPMETCRVNRYTITEEGGGGDVLRLAMYPLFIVAKFIILHAS